MSMSTHVIGFAPPDAKWQKMKEVWDSCVAAGVDIPNEVDAFFGGVEPSEKGVEVEVPHAKWSDTYRQGIEIEVGKIPKHVKLIRFYNSW